MRTLRLLGTSTLSVVSVFTLSIRSGCVPITDHAPESPLRLSLRVPAPRWLYWVSPRQLLQSDTGVPHFALDPLTYRCLLSLSPAADFAEPRPPRHNMHVCIPHGSQPLLQSLESRDSSEIILICWFAVYYQCCDALFFLWKHWYCDISSKIFFIKCKLFYLFWLLINLTYPCSTHVV